MAKVTIDCETYLKLINGTASEGGTTSGGDYTSSDTSSGQSGSGGEAARKQAARILVGRKMKQNLNLILVVITFVNIK